MKKEGKGLVRNFGYSFIANCVSMLISAMVIAIVPKVLGIDEYGYYQLYIFYASYVGFFHFGWCDGIYLKYGGIEYRNYDKRKMSSQFWSMSIIEMFLVIIMFAFVLLARINVNKTFILLLAVLNIIFVIPKTMLSYLLQISGRIREYSYIIILEKVLYGGITVLFLVFGCDSYGILLLIDIFSKICSLALSVLFCRDIVFCKGESLNNTLKEAVDNIKVGSRLLIANIAGMLIMGIVRIAIENNWSIETYSKVSLAINISNLLMVFINAVGIVLFPMIKRMDGERVKQVYIDLRNVLMLFLVVMLMGYYPLQYVLLRWLPMYVESFSYMSILFPVCVFECKMAMLINTYLKALRKEKVLLYVNIFTVVLAICFTSVSVYMFRSIDLALVFIVVLFAMRCILCELVLTKKMQIKILKEILLEVIQCSLFILFNYLFNTIVAFGLYSIVLGAYLFAKKDVLKQLIKMIK